MVQNNLRDRQILVVEDEFIIADDIATRLRAEGAKVLGPVSGLAEALGLVMETGVDAAVLDLNLSGEMVFPLADRLEALDVPFVFATGYTCEAMSGRYSDRPCLNKPFQMQDLIDTLNRTMRG